MMKRRTREHQAVHMRHRHAYRYAFAQRAQHPARRAAVQVNRVARAAVIRGNHIRLAVHAESDVADEACVENRQHGFALILAALRQPLNLGPFGGSEVAHALQFSASRPLRQSQVGLPRPVRVSARRATAAGPGRTSCRRKGTAVSAQTWGSSVARLCRPRNGWRSGFRRSVVSRYRCPGCRRRAAKAAAGISGWRRSRAARTSDKTIVPRFCWRTPSCEIRCRLSSAGRPRQMATELTQASPKSAPSYENTSSTGCSFIFVIQFHATASPPRAPPGNRCIPQPPRNSNADPKDNPRCRLPLCPFHRAARPTPPRFLPGQTLTPDPLAPVRGSFPRFSAAARCRQVPSPSAAAASCHRDLARNPPNNREYFRRPSSRTSRPLLFRWAAARSVRSAWKAIPCTPWLAQTSRHSRDSFPCWDPLCNSSRTPRTARASLRSGPLPPRRASPLRESPPVCP